MTGDRIAMSPAFGAIAKTTGIQSSSVAEISPAHRLLVASESPVLRQALTELLDGAGNLQLVGATDLVYEQMKTALDATDPEIIVLHVQTSSPDDVLDTRILPLFEPMASVLLTSGSSTPVDLAAAARAGVTGFVDDRMGTNELFGAIAAVLTGEAWMSPVFARALLDHYRKNTIELDGRGAAAPLLSVREIEVVRLIGQGRSNIEIASELTLAESTIKTHVSRMLRKLGLRDRTQLARYAYDNKIL